MNEKKKELINRFGLKKKYSENLQLTKEEKQQLLENKIIKKEIQIHYFNPSTNTISKITITLNITACEHMLSLIPIDDFGDPLTYIPEGVETFFQCQICKMELLM